MTSSASVPPKKNHGICDETQVRAYWTLVARQQARHRPGSVLVLAWAPEIGMCPGHHMIVSEVAHQFGLKVPELPVQL